MKIPEQDHQAIVMEWVNGDTSLRDIAARYDVSPETVRATIRRTNRRAPLERLKRQLERQDQAEWDELWSQCEAALREDRRCLVCNAWILRGSGGFKTCSPEHAKAWNVLRVMLNPDQHRQALAKSYLASPERYGETRLNWARRMLSENPPERNRTYLVEGSERAELLRKYRPEIYESLTD